MGMIRGWAAFTPLKIFVGQSCRHWEVFAFPGNVLLPWVEAAENLHFFSAKNKEKE